MVKDAEAHKAEDDQRKSDIETRNKAEAFINQVDEELKTDNPNVTQAQKDEVKKLRDELQEALNKNDMATLKSRMDALEKAANDMAQQMYSQQQANGGGSASSSGSADNSSSSNNDDVMDADFKEKK